MTNLTSDEMAAIIKVVANANNVAESSVQLTTNGSLSISVNGAAQILNLGDYVTQAAVANN